MTFSCVPLFLFISQTIYSYDTCYSHIRKEIVAARYITVLAGQGVDARAYNMFREQLRNQ